MDDNSMSVFIFVTQNTFTRPAEPKTEAARLGLKALWKRFRRFQPPAASIDIQAELHTVSQEILDWIAPVPSWHDTKDALHAALKTWYERDETAQHVQVVIGPPGSGTGQTLSVWAKEKHWDILNPPTPDDILSGGEEWMEKLRENSPGDIVLPALERFYVRHYNGLTLVRHMLEYVNDKTRRWLIGCSSWAWSYLCKTVQIDSFLPAPHALQAFDGFHLKEWLQSLKEETDRCSLIFRQSDSGDPVFPVSIEDNQRVQQGLAGGKGEGVPENAEVSDFMKKMAARGRGIPLVCWAIWRNSLKVTEETTVSLDALKSRAIDKELTIWAQPFNKLQLPEVPSGISRCGSFILHAILLHAGLSDVLMHQLLPFPAHEIIGGLNSLQNHGLIKHEKGLWRVSLVSYPAVRQHLYSEGYLVDAF